MSYPWPSFGSFQFLRHETVIYGTDVGWGLSPSFVQVRPVGSTKDYITATAIGSALRSFEVYLEPDRFLELQAMLNTTDVFTDWERPLPDSRQAFLSEVSPQEKVFHKFPNGFVRPAIRTRLSFLSQ